MSALPADQAARAEALRIACETAKRSLSAEELAIAAERFHDFIIGAPAGTTARRIAAAGTADVR